MNNLRYQALNFAYVGLCCTLTPSGLHSSVPIANAAPVPIQSSNNPDFVWDVFYHHAGLSNKYNAVANVATLYVDYISSLRLLALNYNLTGQVYPTH